MLIGAIVAGVLGILLLLWTAHIVLHILGWVLIVAAVIAVVQYLLAGRNRTRL